MTKEDVLVLEAATNKFVADAQCSGCVNKQLITELKDLLLLVDIDDSQDVAVFHVHEYIRQLEYYESIRLSSRTAYDTIPSTTPENIHKSLFRLYSNLAEEAENNIRSTSKCLFFTLRNVIDKLKKEFQGTQSSVISNPTSESLEDTTLSDVAIELTVIFRDLSLIRKEIPNSDNSVLIERKKRLDKSISDIYRTLAKVRHLVNPKDD